MVHYPELIQQDGKFFCFVPGWLPRLLGTISFFERTAFLLFESFIVHMGCKTKTGGTVKAFAPLEMRQTRWLIVKLAHGHTMSFSILSQVQHDIPVLQRNMPVHRRSSLPGTVLPQGVTFGKWLPPASGALHRVSGGPASPLKCGEASLHNHSL